MTDRDRSAEVAAARNPGKLADILAVPEEERVGRPFSRAAWVKIGIFAALLVVLHYWQLPMLVNKWLDDPNWSHGILIPLFSLYLLYARRHDLRAARRRVCLWGLPILIFGILAQIAAYYPIQNQWLTNLTMTVVLFGLVLYLAGPQIIRLTWLPILFLVFAMPMPGKLYADIALPLQEFAALTSAVILRLCGVQIDVTASNLTVVTRSGVLRDLTIEEACSGVRSLMAFVAIGVAIAYLENRPAWQRVVLVMFTVPIAILCNVIRVAVTCTMYVIDRPDLGQDFMHKFMGLLMLIPAFGMLWAVGWLLQNLFVEEEEDPAEDAPPPKEAATA